VGACSAAPEIALQRAACTSRALLRVTLPSVPSSRRSRRSAGLSEVGCTHPTTRSRRGFLVPVETSGCLAPRRYPEPGQNWTFVVSEGPGDGLASKAHLAVWGRGRETPSTWVVHRIARADRSLRAESVTPSTERPSAPGSGCWSPVSNFDGYGRRASSVGVRGASTDSKPGLGRGFLPPESRLRGARDGHTQRASDEGGRRATRYRRNGLRDHRDSRDHPPRRSDPVFRAPRVVRTPAAPLLIADTTAQTFHLVRVVEGTRGIVRTSLHTLFTICVGSAQRRAVGWPTS
jgi:hypothetical protein